MKESLHVSNTSGTIRELLRQGQYPILAFERALLRLELERFGVEQGVLGKLLGEAMEQSSETWHDNAPADAINHESRILSQRAEKTITQLDSAVVVTYPEADYTTVTLGSILGIMRPGDTNIELLLLTGLSRNAPHLRGNKLVPGGLDVVTVHSPIGEAVLGLELGSIASYEANARRLSFEVASVDQIIAQDIAS